MHFFFTSGWFWFIEGILVSLAVIGLNRMGILSTRQLREHRRHAIVAIVALALLLPGTDPVTTLLELILVMMVLAIVMGGGLGLFAALDVGKRQATGLVKNVLRTAQNSAIARQSPAGAGDVHHSYRFLRVVEIAPVSWNTVSASAPSIEPVPQEPVSSVCSRTSCGSTPALSTR